MWQCWPNQQEFTYISSAQTLDVVWKNSWRWWMTGTDKERERESQGNPCCQPDLMMRIYNTRLSQKFCNILVMWSTNWQLQMLLPRSQKWQAMLNCEMSSMPDTLRELLTGFALMAFKPTWLLRFYQSKWNFFNRVLTVLWPTVPPLIAQ